MKQKLALGVLALLLTVGANLHLCRHVSVSGAEVDGSFSPDGLDRAVLTAERTAEELLPGEAALPAYRLRYSLSLRPAEDDTAALSDALLRGTDGLCVEDAVFVNGVALGHVADGAALEEALRVQLYAGRPSGAVNGRYTEEIALRGVYTRAGTETKMEDMLLLVGGMCPVLYTDAEGRVVLG